MLRKTLIAAFLVGLIPVSGAAASAGGATVSRVTVTFTDNGLRATPTTPSSGPTTFVVFNKGKKAHLLEVKGPGVNGKRTAKIAAGRSGKLTVTLKPGSYVLSDPVGLGVYQAVFLDVIPSTTVTAKGDGSVVSPPAQLPPMCGTYLTP